MRHIILPALAALMLSAPAFAESGKLLWDSNVTFVGQTNLPSGGTALTYLAEIRSTTPDASGNYELFVLSKPFYQESYADHLAIEMREACNATGDNSCVLNQPGWTEYLEVQTTPAQ